MEDSPVECFSVELVVELGLVVVGVVIRAYPYRMILAYPCQLLLLVFFIIQILSSNQQHVYSEKYTPLY